MQRRSGNIVELHAELQAHLVVVVRPWRDLDVHADVLVLEGRDWLLSDAPLRDGGERGDGNGDALAELSDRGLAVDHTEPWTG